MTVSTPDIQAPEHNRSGNGPIVPTDIQTLIERAERHLPFVKRTGSDTTVLIIRDLTAALSALSGETETEWETTWAADLPGGGLWLGKNGPIRVRSDGERFLDWTLKESAPVLPTVRQMRRRKAGPWIEVTK